MRILHVFRTPVGGLFKHVRDLARGQQEAGHAVGILCDSTTGGESAARLLASAEKYFELGIARIPISRMPGLGDLSGVRQTAAHAATVNPSIIHCHGAKGGLYGRLAGWQLGIPTVYTPHGGSLHYRWGTPQGAVFLATEWALARLGTALHFVCAFEKRTFDAKIGIGKKANAVVYNGLWPEEFRALPVNGDADDIIYIGEMRTLKGVDVLIEALRLCAREHRISACLVGDGSDLELFQRQVQTAALEGLVHFAGRLPASEAFKRGRIFVMPSRAESFPYVVLEAAAAGRPIIASDVGGVGEAVPADRLVPAGDAAALAARLLAAIKDPATLQQTAAADHTRIAQTFTAEHMVEGVLSLYRQAGAI